MDCSNHQKRRVKGWAEEDAYTAWRRLYCYLRRPGAVKGIKRATHRRERREARQEIAEQLEDAAYGEDDMGALKCHLGVRQVSLVEELEARRG